MQPSRQEIIMNFSTPPCDDDLLVLARNSIENMPDEFAAFCKDIDIVVEDFVDEHTESLLDTEDAYEVLLYLKSGKEISPGIESVSSSNIYTDARLLIIGQRLKKTLPSWSRALYLKKSQLSMNTQQKKLLKWSIRTYNPHK